MLNNILSVLKINPVVKKIQNHSNKCVQHVWGTDRQTDRQTATLNGEISTVWETKPTVTAGKGSELLVGPEQGTRVKTLQAV
jgi:hypothetical protein